MYCALGSAAAELVLQGKGAEKQDTFQAPQSQQASFYFQQLGDLQLNINAHEYPPTVTPGAGKAGAQFS